MFEDSTTNTTETKENSYSLSFEVQLLLIWSPPQIFNNSKQNASPFTANMSVVQLSSTESNVIQFISSSDELVEWLKINCIITVKMHLIKQSIYLQIKTLLK